MLTHAFGALDWSELEHRKHRDRFLRCVCSHFCVWLHDTHGMSWATGQFFSDRLGSFLFDDRPRLEKRKKRGKRREPGHRLNPDEAFVEAYICQTCQEFFHVDGMQALSLLQALWFLPDFVSATGSPNSSEYEGWRDAAVGLAEKVKGVACASDDGLVIFETFPEYAFSRHAVCGDRHPDQVR